MRRGDGGGARRVTRWQGAGVQCCRALRPGRSAGTPLPWAALDHLEAHVLGGALNHGDDGLELRCGVWILMSDAVLGLPQ